MIGRYKMRKILRWVLCLSVMVLAFGCAVASAESNGTCGVNVVWTLDDDGLLTIRGTGSIDNHPWDANAVRNVVIGPGVTSICQNAFSDCSSLASVSIPESVTFIDECAFLRCSSLASVTIPEGVTIIENCAFMNCNSLTSITLPRSVTSIDASAFTNCSSLTSIALPESLTSIGFSAFSGCSNLTSIMLPKNVTSIRNNTFSDCISLTSVSIPDNVTDIGYYAFQGCSSLTSIALPESVTSIGVSAFQGCSSLTSISIPEGVTRIERSTFDGCSNLASVTILDGMTIIDYRAFSDCSSLTSIALPEGVTSIGFSAFSDCNSLTSITIPKSVTSIDNNVFSGCNRLTSIVLPDGIAWISDHAFENCSNLTNIILPERLTSIGASAFNGCSSLASIMLPEGVTSIGDLAFYDCSSLTRITIPEGVTNISHNTFGFCRSLKSIMLPQSVTSIDDYAFQNCRSLTSITLPGSLTSIGNEVFLNCSSLMSVSIPEGMTNIGASAFTNCYSLTSLTIPESVTSIGNSAFYGCSQLSRVAFLLMDESAAISYGENVFDSAPTLYCYMFTQVDGWASSKGYSIVYLDEIDIADIRMITMNDDFRLPLSEVCTLEPCVFPADGEPIIWYSSDPGVVNVNNGMVSAVNPGTVTVTATFGGVSASVIIEVFIPAADFTISESEVWVLAKSPLQLSVVSQTPVNASSTFTWTSSDENRAVVDETGLLTTFIPGDIIITATSELGLQRECLVHLCYPVTGVSLSAPFEKLLTGNNMQLSASVTMRTQQCINHLVTFTSNDEAVATVDTETGMMHGLAEGTVTITATSASGKRSSVTIHVMDVCDEHTPVMDIPISPTNTETGLTEGRHCGVCNEVLTAQKSIPALDTLRVPDFPDNLTVLGAGAFEGTNFEAVVIPETVTSIGTRTFANCPNLIYVRIPASVNEIASDAFIDCPKLLFIDRFNE